MHVTQPATPEDEAKLVARARQFIQRHGLKIMLWNGGTLKPAYTLLSELEDLLADWPGDPREGKRLRRLWRHVVRRVMKGKSLVLFAPETPPSDPPVQPPSPRFTFYAASPTEIREL